MADNLVLNCLALAFHKVVYFGHHYFYFTQMQSYGFLYSLFLLNSLLTKKGALKFTTLRSTAAIQIIPDVVQESASTWQMEFSASKYHYMRIGLCNTPLVVYAAPKFVLARSQRVMGIMVQITNFS